MTSSLIIQFDARLKALSKESPALVLPNWKPYVKNLANGAIRMAQVRATTPHNGAHDVTMAYLCEMLARAFAREQMSIHDHYSPTEADGRLVADLAAAVAISRWFVQADAQTLREEDVYGIVERTLIARHHRSLAVALNSELERERTLPRIVTTRVIRRNGDVVDWSPAKIENALRKALVAVGLESGLIGFAQQVAERTSNAVLKDNTEFIPIDELQDLVIEMMCVTLAAVEDRDQRRSLGRATQAYISYRMERDALRQAGEVNGAVVVPAQAELPELLQVRQFMVRNETGELVFWDQADLRARIAFASQGLELKFTPAEMQDALMIKLADGMSRQELTRVIQQNSLSLIERDPEFSIFSARIHLTYLYEQALGWDILRDGVDGLRHAHVRRFAGYIADGIEKQLLEPAIATISLATLEQALDPKFDLSLDFAALQLLLDAHLLEDATGPAPRLLEVPQFMWMRIAMGLAYADEDSTAWAVKFYRLFAQGLFNGSAPDLLKAGLLNARLADSHGYKVDDTLDSALSTGIALSGSLLKGGGGLSGSWTQMRERGATIIGDAGTSAGPVPFLQLQKQMMETVRQEGNRPPYSCAYLEAWHPDVEQFLRLHDGNQNAGVLAANPLLMRSDLRSAVWLPDLFFKRVAADSEWTLFSPQVAPDLHAAYGLEFDLLYEDYERQAAIGKIRAKKVPARDLWDKILKAHMETGYPWLGFKDHCNLRSPQDHAGVVYAAGPDGDTVQSVKEGEVSICYGGAINLVAHLQSDGELNLNLLRETVHTAVRLLDNAIYVDSRKISWRYGLEQRAIGLSVMGLQTALYQKKVPFGSNAAIQFNSDFAEALSYYAIEASCDLAVERGSYDSFQDSKWWNGVMPQDSMKAVEEHRGSAVKRVGVVHRQTFDWDALRKKVHQQGLRNSSLLALTPTPFCSTLVGVSSSIEATTSNVTTVAGSLGKFNVLNRDLVHALKVLGLWSIEIREQLRYHSGRLEQIEGLPAEVKDLFATADTIPWPDILSAAAARDRHIDQAQTIHLVLPRADSNEIGKIIREARELGLRTLGSIRIHAEHRRLRAA